MILCLETATPVCSVALNDGSRTLALRECKGQNAHSEKITLFIKEVLEEAGIGYDRLDAVAVSKGPGSYTGLRIGVSTAKGVCYAADKPLIAVDTLQAMAIGMRQRLSDSLQPADLLVPMIDARRMEVYCSVFDANLHRVKDTAAVVFDVTAQDAPSIGIGSFLHLSVSVPNGHHYLFGDGAPKLAPLFADIPEVHVINDFGPSAAYMASLADQALRAKDFVDVAYFEPFYLKDFVAGKPHVKGLGESGKWKVESEELV